MKKLFTYFIVAICFVFISFNFSEAKIRKNGKANVKSTSSIYTSNSIPNIFNLDSYENYIRKNGKEFKSESPDERYTLSSFKYCFTSKDSVVFNFFKMLKKKGNSPDAIEIIIPIDDYDDGLEVYKTLQSLISKKYGIDYDSICTGYDNYNLVFLWGNEILSKRKNKVIGVDTVFRPNFSDMVDSKYVIKLFLGPFKTNTNN